MNEILLKKVYLINWYGFVDKTIPIGRSLSLITGENECGKSTILDAIKYAFTGDTEFNKATSATRVGTGRRTLSSYTRCLIDPDNKKYARSSDSHPSVYTHIALEYHNTLYDTYFVLGVILETDSSDNVNNFWYAQDGKRLEDLSFFRESEGKKFVLNAKEFGIKNQAKIMNNKKDGIEKFMAMTGLKLQNDGIMKYRRKLKNIMTYNPEAKIQQFIKESVLEEKKININKLKEAKESIEEITKSFTILEKEIRELDAILKAFDDYKRICSRLTKDDIKRVYKDLLANQKEKENSIKEMKEHCREIEMLAKRIDQELLEKEKKDKELRKALQHYDQMDATKAIREEKEKLDILGNEMKELSEKEKEIKILFKQIKQFMETIKLAMKPLNVSDLDDPSAARKEVDSLRETVKHLFEQNAVEINRLKGSLKQMEEEKIVVDQVIKTCERNLPDYSKVPNQYGLLNEINNKFKSLGIQSEAKFSSAYVVELKDEEWRNSIETFLGWHRYSVLVEPEYFDIADQVMDRSRYKYVELVNTKLLSRKEPKIVEDSLLNKLVIKNKIAHTYFAYWLGRIHAVEKKNVSVHENAISKEGKISRNMAVSFLNFNKIGSYCLGEDAVLLNKERALKEKKELEEEEVRIRENIYLQQRRKMAIDNMFQALNKQYDFEAPVKMKEKQEQIEICKASIQKLEDALKNNNEYMALVERRAEIESSLVILNQSIEKNKKRKIQLEQKNDSLKIGIEQLTKSIEEKNGRIDAFSIDYLSEFREAKKEYDLFLAKERESGDVLVPSSRERAEREKSSCEKDIIQKQSNYNMGKYQEEELPVDFQSEEVYRKRKNRLQVDDFEDIKQKLAIRTKQYENIFKNEFVLKIKTNIEDAHADIKEINRQLRKLQFSTTYQFDVRNVSGTTDYAKILDYAEYLKKNNQIGNLQGTLEGMNDFDEKEAIKQEEEIKKIINKIVAKEHNNELVDFSDYRNYMEYEVIVNNEEIKNGRLSKLAGYNSGAGTQIPYTIILSAALAMIYNARQNSTRMVFIDEPFEKMSDKNIKIMLNFFKSQSFQVIFCAPPNKLDSIGKECAAVIPIKKISKSNMTVGWVEFNE